MEKVRIGNDIQVKYTVLRDGLPESFVGATNIAVEVKNEAYGKIIPSTFSIVDNVVNVVLDAKDCVLCGKHRVTLSYNRVNDITIDALAFELVQYTSLTGGTEIVGVEIVTVNISGDIGINRDGLSAYEVWESYPGNEGKTIEQYFEWLRENPTKTDTSRKIIAGLGLTGGGDLAADLTIDVVSANDGITVNADNIQLNTIDNVTSTSTTKPLSANQGKVLNDKVVQVETDLNGKINTTDVEQVRSQATNKVASSKLLDDELKKIEKKSEQIEDYFELSITTPEITCENFAVNTSGQLDNNAQYSHCSPIQVFRGDKVYAKARIDVVLLSAIALTDSTQTFYQSVVAGSNTGEVTVREYEILADGYITCSYRTDLGLTVEIISSQRINEINEKIQENTADIITLENDVLSLTEEINSYILDRSKSYLKITTRNGKTIDLSGLWNAGNPITLINWGDGNITTPSQASHLAHKYVSSGSYLITIDNLTIIPNGSFSSKSFYDMDNLDELYIGSTIQSIGNSGILINAYLKKIQFLGPDVPTTGTNSLQLLQLYPVDKCIVSDESFYKWVSQSKFTSASIVRQITNESNTLVGNKLVVTVGSGGNFNTISDALRYLSTLKPIFKQSGVACQVKILSGTTISEQILISGIDLSYITIVYEDYTPTTVSDLVLSQLANGTIIPGTTSGWAVVPVNSTGWGNISHDSRGYAPFFSAENGGKLPQIGCIFKLTTAGATKSVAYFCNKGSSGIVRTFCGFIDFPVGVISNNESSVTIREGLTMNCSDWGIHARHNGEISARSLVASNCGTNTDIDVMACAAYADRIADIDIREAWLDGSRVAMRAHNISRLNANGANITGGGASGSYLVQSGNGGIVNCSEMAISNPTGNIFQVATGGSINVFSPMITGATGTILSQTKNIVSENGIIYSNV